MVVPFVPNSGTEWKDDIIRSGSYSEFAVLTRVTDGNELPQLFEEMSWLSHTL